MPGVEVLLHFDNRNECIRELFDHRGNLLQGRTANLVNLNVCVCMHKAG